MRISDWSSDVCSSDLNINGSTIMTTASTSFELSWEHSKLIATMADRMGLDFLVSVARWSGFDGPSRFAQEAFETLTYIAGLAAVTNRILVFRSEEHTSELQSLMRNSYAVFCLTKTKLKKPNRILYTQFDAHMAT